MAVTDHGTLAALRDAHSAAEQRGIKIIFGLEAYISETDRFDRRAVAKRDDNTSAYNHIILLAKNDVGFKNLNKLSEIAWNEGFYSKPRIDRELLKEYREGIIVLSGCLSGLLSKAFLRGELETARGFAVELQNSFGDDFYIEVQSHNPPELNQFLLETADNLGIRAVATGDCHHANGEDRWIEDAMLILSAKPKIGKGVTYEAGKKLGDIFQRLNYLYPDRTMSFQNFHLFVQSREEIEADFKAAGIDRTDIFTNTLLVADKVEPYTMSTGKDLLPRPPKTQDPHKLLRERVYEGLKKRGLLNTPGYKERADEELDVIISKDFSTYFLIEADFIKYCYDNDIFVGPGRGSGAGSLVNYALRITNVDPIKHNLLFFRFINPERNDMPDIDSDIQDDRRDEVKDYILRKYKNMAAISIWGTFAGKSAIKDAARVFQLPLGIVNMALKGANYPPNKDFFEEWGASPAGKKFHAEYPEVMTLARYLHGRIRSHGMHAGGIVISKEPISNHAPMQTATHPRDKSLPRVPVVAVDMEGAEEIGFIKYDLLGLKALSVIKQTKDLIRKRHGKTIDLDNLPLDDADVYAMLSEGHTKGVFQCEQGPYTNLIFDMGGISNFDELVMSNALVRPGASKSSAAADFIGRKRGQRAIEFVHEDVRWFTEESYGAIIFQEQVMLAMTELAGMKMTTADKVRKIIGKKKDVREFEQYQEEFIEGASRKVSRTVAEGLWHDFEAHAGYSFNKSHSVAYSMLSYWTAWLKYHYPLEFMVSMLKNEKSAAARLDCLMEAKRIGIRVLLPHINSSDVDFSIQTDDRGDFIRFGLANIKYLSEKTAPRIIEGRPWKSYKEFSDRVMEKGSGLSTRALQGLNAIGGAVFPDNPPHGRERENFYEYLAIPAFDTKGLDPHIRAQLRPLAEFEDGDAFLCMGMVTNIKSGTGWALVELVDETGKAGVFTDEYTPIEKGRLYVFLVSNNRIARYMTIEEINENSTRGFVKFLAAHNLPDVPDGMLKVVSFKSRTTRAGAKMAHAVFSTPEKELIPAMVFPKQFHKAFGACKEGAVVTVDLAETEDGAMFVSNIL